MTIELEGRLVGGIPVVPEGADRADVYEKWARGQGVEEAPEFEKPLHEVLAADPDMPVDVAVEEIVGPSTGFRADEQGIYIEARQVKAMIREGAQRLGYIQSVRGTRQVIQHDVHVRAVGGRGQKLRFVRDGVALTEVDGMDSRPIAVVTRQGPRTTIKRFQYVEDCEISFDVLLLKGGVGDGIVQPEHLQRIFEFGGFLGLGADRSQGEGTFSVVLIEEIR